MKKMSFRLMAAMLSCAVMLFATSCSDDDDEVKKEENSNVPVLNEDFAFVVASNDVTFTTSLTGTTWFQGNDNDYTVTDGQAKVNLPIAGTYSFVCKTLVNGVEFASDPFDVVIASSDLSYLTKGVWKALTNGKAGYNKTWVLDLVTVVSTTIDDAGTSTSTTSYKSSYFHNPLDFYGDAEAGGAEDNIWGPWGGTNLYGWGGTPEIGEISFDGATGAVKLVMTDGVNADGTGVAKTDGTGYEYGKNATAKNGTFEGTFAMTTVVRDPEFCTISAKNNSGTEVSLWDYMLEKTGYKNIGKLSDSTATIEFSEGLRFPMDKGRVGEKQFTDTDLRNVMIMHASDSALVIRVKRSFEGYDETTGAQKANTCWLLYNYVVKGYDYGVKESVTHPVKSITATDLNGTWKLAAVPANWIGWSAKNELNTWADGAAMNATFVSWNIANTTEKLAASTKVTLTFDNGTCTIKDVTFDGTNEVVNDQTTTYTVTNGYITFGSAVTITGYTDMISLSGTNMYAVDVTGSTEGIWLGKNNGDKEETSAIHMIKQ
ncbi:MAG: hypothetical protein JXR39_06370 [Marinilabiliaceae bacterium]|nr:hypothetical protein [Marinilabiliaceae bacterium]